MKMQYQRVYILFVFVLFLTKGYTQPVPFNKATVDSLTHVLPFMKDDINKINSLVLLSQMYIAKGDSVMIMKYAHEADTLSQKINSNIGRVNALGSNGLLSCWNGQLAAVVDGNK